MAIPIEPSAVVGAVDGKHEMRYPPRGNCRGLAGGERACRADARSACPRAADFPRRSRRPIGKPTWPRPFARWKPRRRKACGSESDVAVGALRMLYLLAGRRDDAMRPLPASPKSTQEYWTSQVYGLATWMDADKTPDPARRAAEAKRILTEAVNQLGRRPAVDRPKPDLLLVGAVPTDRSKQ